MRAAAMARDNRFKLILRPETLGPDEFFDLRNDRGERTNDYANPSFVDARNRLAGELRTWRDRYSG